MIKQSSIAAIAAAAALLAPSAFASGYGPAPYYNAGEGAPASQRGVSSQTFAVELAQAQNNAAVNHRDTLQAKTSSNEATQ